MIRNVKLLISMLVFGLFQTAWGQSQEAEKAYLAGEYDVAFADVAADRGADACAFGARMLLAKAMSGDVQPPRSLLSAALAEANNALVVEPQHIEGRLQKAIALSLLVRPMSLREARDSGFGEEARALAEAVLVDDPANAYAHGFLAVWHIEVINRGGFLGAMVLGASMDDAEEVSDALNAALAAPVGSVLEQVMQDRARTLSAAVASSSTRDVEALAKTML